MIRYIVSFTLLSVVVFALTVIPNDANGCAAVPREGHDYIRIAEESAIIVWDPVKKVEHFIRSAAFDTKSPDFGFLVPTPKRPVLKELEPVIFAEASRWIVPRVVVQSRVNFGLFINQIGCTKSAMMRDMTPGSAVRILEQAKVGGYDYAVLEADQTEALAKWLKDNGYSNDPELQSWLFPYVTNEWKITAFKISQDRKTGQLATTKPVRMTFETDRPFFPYREPEEKKVKEGDKNPPRNGRLLRVFFVSDTRVDGKLGAANWHATIPWSDELEDAQRKQLAAETGVPEADIPAKAWMTTFEDRASPRPGKDEVYFDPAQDRTPIRPPDIIRYVDSMWIPLDCLVAAVCLIVIPGGGILLHWLTKKKPQAST